MKFKTKGGEILLKLTIQNQCFIHGAEKEDIKLCFVEF